MYRPGLSRERPYTEHVVYNHNSGFGIGDDTAELVYGKII